MKGLLGTFSLLVALATATSSFAGDPVTRGRELFTSRQLGTNGKSCSTCHADAGKFRKVATYKDETLVDIVNNCIEKALKGKPLPPDSDDMKALVAYLRSVAQR